MLSATRGDGHHLETAPTRSVHTPCTSRSASWRRPPAGDGSNTVSTHALYQPLRELETATTWRRLQHGQYTRPVPAAPRTGDGHQLETAPTRSVHTPCTSRSANWRRPPAGDGSNTVSTHALYQPLRELETATSWRRLQHGQYTRPVPAAPRAGDGHQLETAPTRSVHTPCTSRSGSWRRPLAGDGSNTVSTHALYQPLRELESGDGHQLETAPTRSVQTIGGTIPIVGM